MKEPWREVVIGIATQCQPTNTKTVFTRFMKGCLTFVRIAECWKEEKRMVGRINLLQGWKDMYVIVANLLAILKVNKALSSDMWREHIFKNIFRNNANIEWSSF